MKRRSSVSVLVLMLALFVPGLASADPSGGSQTMYLSKIWSEMKKEIELFKEQLEEAKVMSDGVMQARDVLQGVKEEYEFVTNFNPRAELSELQRWAEGYTYLDDISDAGSFEARWAMLYGEVSKRFKAAGIEDQERIESEARRVFVEQEQQRLLLEKYRAAALDLNSNATDKDLQRQIASSSALTASLLLEQKIERLESEIRAREVVLKQVEWDAAFMNYLEGAEDGR